jgi:putative transposase
VAFIEANKKTWGIEPICEVLQFAPSTYYAARSRSPSARQVLDAVLIVAIVAIHKANFGVYGVEKVWHQLRRDAIDCGRDRVGRLMRELGLRGVRREKTTRTTTPGEAAERPEDLVKRDFSASQANRLWVADLTYVWTTTRSFAYVAFVIDVYSRRIVGWKVANHLRTELALDALEMAIFSRRGADLSHLVHHSDRGVQYLAVRYTERLAATEAVASVGSKGDSYDNALAEAVNALFKAELVRHQGPFKDASELERATAAWVDWWNNRRLHGALGFVPPAEYEQADGAKAA